MTLGSSSIVPLGLLELGSGHSLHVGLNLCTTLSGSATLEPWRPADEANRWEPGLGFRPGILALLVWTGAEAAEPSREWLSGRIQRKFTKSLRKLVRICDLWPASAYLHDWWLKQDPTCSFPLRGSKPAPLQSWKVFSLHASWNVKTATHQEGQRLKASKEKAQNQREMSFVASFSDGEVCKVLFTCKKMSVNIAQCLGCVTLDKLLDSSECQVLHLQNGNNSFIYFTRWL